MSDALVALKLYFVGVHGAVVALKQCFEGPGSSWWSWRVVLGAKMVKNYFAVLFIPILCSNCPTCLFLQVFLKAETGPWTGLRL